MIPQIQGPYAYIELYAKSNRAWYFGFDVFDDTTNTGMNLSLYDAQRLQLRDATGNVVVNLTSNASQISVVNVSSILINATASVMNIDSGYYSGDIDFLTGGEWEPQFTVNLRVDG